MFSANVDWSRLAGYPRLKIILENILRVDPYKRWDANMVLAYAQEDFVVDIQRVWRGCTSIIIINIIYSQVKERIQEEV